MPFLILAKNFVLNPRVLGAIAAIMVIGLVYFKISNLENELEISKENTIKLKSINKSNVDTIKNLQNELQKTRENQEIVIKSYNEEIEKYKKLLINSTKKIVYKDRIKIKIKKVPKIIKGKTVYINKCEPIKIHRLDKNDTNNSMIKILSNIGK